MTSHPPGYPGRVQCQAGFSLIELMIAITLGLLILAGMTAVFVNTSAARNEIDRANRQIENGRYATELLRDDIQLAGFLGEINMPLVALAGADPCSVVVGEWAKALKMHIQGFNDYAGALACLTNVKAGTDVLIIRRAKTCFAGDAGCDPLDAAAEDKPFLQVSRCTTDTETHVLNLKKDGAFDLKNTKCDAKMGIRPYVVYFYYVSDPDFEPDKISKLKRAEFTGSAIGNVTALVDGIENLQVEYGVDTSGDGNPDSFTASPATVDDWGNVVTVKFYLLVRNTEASQDGYKDKKTYDLGLKGIVGPFDDKFRRHVYTTLVRIRNVSGRREKP